MVWVRGEVSSPIVIWRTCPNSIRAVKSLSDLHEENSINENVLFFSVIRVKELKYCLVDF